MAQKNATPTKEQQAVLKKHKLPDHRGGKGDRQIKKCRIPVDETGTRQEPNMTVVLYHRK